MPLYRTTYCIYYYIDKALRVEPCDSFFYFFAAKYMKTYAIKRIYVLTSLTTYEHTAINVTWLSELSETFVVRIKYLKLGKFRGATKITKQNGNQKKLSRDTAEIRIPVFHHVQLISIGTLYFLSE